MEKKEIRKQIREIKKQYTLEDKKRMSASVWQQVEHNEVFQRARVVLAYWSMDDEVLRMTLFVNGQKKRPFYYLV